MRFDFLIIDINNMMITLKPIIPALDDVIEMYFKIIIENDKKYFIME